MSVAYISRAAQEAAFLRHVFDPNCDDCLANDYPCADHRRACTNGCGRDGTHPLRQHPTKVDMRGQPISEWMCDSCDPGWDEEMRRGL